MPKLQITSIEFRPTPVHVRSPNTLDKIYVASGSEWREWSVTLSVNGVEFRKNKRPDGSPVPAGTEVVGTIVPRDACFIRFKEVPTAEEKAAAEKSTKKEA